MQAYKFLGNSRHHNTQTTEIVPLDIDDKALHDKENPKPFRAHHQTSKNTSLS
ncbi:MAG: hypothetical protein KUG76_05415 [Gammaproteobacteria bacterium]|nr:hypothetical protein [Gammaproteobacteria bacterium]